VKELIKKQVLKITVGGVFICSFILASMYPVISASHKDKIHFLLSPDPFAVFTPPPGKEADVMFVWVGVVKDSTYGSFIVAIVGYESYYVDHDRYEYHWYTDNLKDGETYAYLSKNAHPTTWEGKPIEYEYDFTMAKIEIARSEHQLNATVVAKGTMLFSAGFWANTSAELESRIEPGGPLPQELYLSVEAYRPTLQPLVSGVEVGNFMYGRFKYIDTELYDSSLLP